MANSLERDDLINTYFAMGMTCPDICSTLAQQHGITISNRHLKRDLKRLNLKRRHFSDLDDAVTFISNQLEGSGKLHGYRMMHAKCKDNGIQVRKEDVRIILKELDPEGVEMRKARRLRRRAYYAKGPNFVWHVDGYDKLKPYGLCISGCIDGFSRKLIWLKVYHTNNNPRVIAGYFWEALKESGGCPFLVRADYGTENGSIRVLQEVLRGAQSETVYLDGASTANQRIESWWGFLRKECMDFWIDLLKDLLERGLYTGVFLDKSLVQFCFTGVIQDELDATASIWNNHTIRPSSNDRVPSGRPTIMYYAPHLWSFEDQLVVVSEDDINACSGEVQLRSDRPCDADVYDVCISIMSRDNINPPCNAQEARSLFLHLKRELLALA